VPFLRHNIETSHSLQFCDVKTESKFYVLTKSDMSRSSPVQITQSYNEILKR